MKKFLTFMIFTALCLFVSAKTSNEVMRDIRHNNKTMTIRFNKLMLAMMPDLHDDLWKPALRHIRSGTIIIIDDEDDDAGKSIQKSIDELDDDTYQALTSITYDDETVQLIGKIRNDTVKELLIVITDGGDGILIRLKGNLTKDDIQKIIDNKETT